MIIADEPTGNLDKITEKEILDIFQKLAHEDGKCVLIMDDACVEDFLELVKQMNELT